MFFGIKFFFGVVEFFIFFDRDFFRLVFILPHSEVELKKKMKDSYDKGAKTRETNRKDKKLKEVVKKVVQDVSDDPEEVQDEAEEAVSDASVGEWVAGEMRGVTRWVRGARSDVMFHIGTITGGLPLPSSSKRRGVGVSKYTIHYTCDAKTWLPINSQKMATTLYSHSATAIPHPKFQCPDCII